MPQKIAHPAPSIKKGMVRPNQPRISNNSPYLSFIPSFVIFPFIHLFLWRNFLLQKIINDEFASEYIKDNIFELRL